MDAKFKELANEINYISRVYDQTLKQYDEYKIIVAEIHPTGDLLEISNQRSSETFTQMNKTIQNVGEAIKNLSNSGQHLLSEFDKIQSPLTNLSRNVNLLQSKTTLNSNILSYSQTKNLIDLIDFPIDTKWTLLYSGERDGFGAADFHSRCDFKSPTLTVIKSENGNIFGGYTEAMWTSENEKEMRDPKSFVFSLVNEFDKPYVARIEDACNPAIKCSPMFGPIFGYNEICVMDECCNSMENKSNYSYFFEKPVSLNYDFDEGNKVYLSGSNLFKVIGIEVFQNKN